MNPRSISPPKNRNKYQSEKTFSCQEYSSSFANAYSQMFEENPFPLLVIDSKNFSIKRANKAACTFYGYTKNAFSKINLVDIDITVKDKTPSQILKHYKKKRLNTRHRLKNGSVLDVETYNSFFSDQDRQLFSSLIIKSGEHAQSVSGKEKQLEELKLRFLSTSSHEFRTPLTTILTSSEVLLMIGRSLSEERYVDYIIQIQNAVFYMTSLLDDILTINKTEIGKWKFCPSKIDLYDFLIKVIDEAKNLASAYHNFNVLFEMKNNHAIVDNKLLHHILLNLLSNAIKYSPKGGEITLKVRGSKSEIEFIISDDGIGISKQNQSKLFEAFYRGDNTGEIEGTGLGLSIVKRCIESHGGKITFKSKLNKGSTFTVAIPMMTMV